MDLMLDLLESLLGLSGLVIKLRYIPYLNIITVGFNFMGDLHHQSKHAGEFF